jgi:hypothetical protein
VNIAAYKDLHEIPLMEEAALNLHNLELFIFGGFIAIWK